MKARTDPQLLRAYAECRSEASFAELVRRHIDLVHSAASRMVNDSHLAKDVTQSVFVALAKDAEKLTDHPVLSGWLHRTTRNIAAQTVRTEVRRRNREKEAAAMNAHPETDATWQEIAPHLDAALADLSEPDRDAVLLRYFENKPAQEMAAILGISAEAAQKRVSRAVEKLRENFAKRGITAGATGLSGVISANAVQAAPAGLAASVSSTAFVAASAVTKVIIVNLLRKAALGTAAAAALFTAIHQTIRVSEMRRKNQAIKQELATHPINGASQGMAFSEAGRATEIGNAGLAVPEAETKPADPGDFRVMASVGGPNDPKDFALFAPAGRGITTGAAEIVGLDSARRKAVDKILRTNWKRMEDDFASRAVEIPAKTAGTKAFSIPARGDGGSGPRRQLEADLDAEVGVAKRKILMGNLEPYEFFAGFGGMDVRMEFKNSSCECWITDHGSGEQQCHMSMGYDGFIDRFGTSFELPKPNDQPLIHR